MKQSTKVKGSQAEKIAESYLKKKGYGILGRNLFFRYGEIDILAQKNEELVVVEVKYKNSDNLGSAEEMITPIKRKKLINLAKLASEQYLNENVRIDVIAINGDKINHLENALEE